MLTRTREGGLEGFQGSTKLGLICPASGAICSTVTTGGPAGVAGFAGATLRGAGAAGAVAPPTGAAAGAAAAAGAGAGAGGCGRFTRESRPALAPAAGGTGAAFCAAARGATSMRSERVAMAEKEILRFTISALVERKSIAAWQAQQQPDDGDSMQLLCRTTARQIGRVFNHLNPPRWLYPHRPCQSGTRDGRWPPRCVRMARLLDGVGQLLFLAATQDSQVDRTLRHHALVDVERLLR